MYNPLTYNKPQKSEVRNQCPECLDYLDSLKFGETCKGCRAIKRTTKPAIVGIKGYFLVLFATYWVCSVGLPFVNRFTPHDAQREALSSEEVRQANWKSPRYQQRQQRIQKSLLNALYTNANSLRNQFLSKGGTPETALNQMKEIFMVNPEEPLTGEGLKVYEVITSDAPVDQSTIEVPEDWKSPFSRIIEKQYRL